MAAKVEIHKGPAGRIVLSFPYNPLHVAQVKALKGNRWHPKERYWTVPYSEGTIRAILSIFEGLEVKIDPAFQVIREPEKEKGPLEELYRELMRRKYSRRTIKR